MKRVLFSTIAIVSTLSTPQLAQAKDRPLFSPAPLSSFDGTKWSGLVLGQTTFKQIRPLYETGGSAYDHATELTQAKGSGLRISCLWSKRGNDEVLSAITFRYSGTTPSSDQLQTAFDPDGKLGQDLYERGRYEDWRVVRFPRGVAAFQLRQGDAYTTPLIVFSAPTSLNHLTEQLVHDETPVEERIDPHANDPKVGEFGDINLAFDGKDSDDIPSWVRSDLRSDLKDATAHGTLDYRRGAGGYYKMNISSSRAKNDQSGSFSVNATIQADGPYGTISATGSGSQRWKVNDDDYPHTPSEAFNRAVREARRDAEDSFERKMRASGPPTLEQVRESRWNDLVAMLRSSQVPQLTPTTGGKVAGF